MMKSISFMLLLAGTVSSFSTTKPTTTFHPGIQSMYARRMNSRHFIPTTYVDNQMNLFSSDPQGNNNMSSEEESTSTAPVSMETSSLPNMNTNNTPTMSEPEGTEPPLNIPSPILLASSMILAIVGTGSAFDLANPNPNLGFGTTAALAAISIPLCFFLFYASILKATAETEADDKEFMKGKY